MNSLEKWLFKMISQYSYPYHHPPLDMRKIYLPQSDYKMVVCLNNDGHETWIGTENNWHTHMKNSEFTKVCVWYLGVRIFIDWFGLRSKLYFYLLNRSCKRYSAR